MADILLTTLLSVLVPLGFIIGLFILGRRARARLKARFPPPGTLVDVGDGRRLHIHATGDSSTALPTVILEAGRGDISLTWADVQTELTKFTRVVSYDRAGLGWSDWSKKERTIRQVVEDLHCALIASGEKSPFVLVGHSMGGVFVRLYAQIYPDQVVGMVLVDPGHEDWMRDVNLCFRILDRFNDAVLLSIARLLQFLNLIGLLALMADCCKLGCPLVAPTQVSEAYASVFFRDNKHIRACIDEVKKTNKQFAEARAAGGTVSLGEIPVLVLSASPFPVPEGCWSCLASAVEHGNAQRTKQLNELAALSSGGRLVVAEESGHHVHVDKPGVVVDGIKDVLEETRN